jgi:hypothetical protein
MLYWGVFTSGFIIGGVFVAYILDRRELGSSKFRVKTGSFGGKFTNSDPDTLFDQITQINYFPHKFSKQSPLKI